ncbi:MAG: hypothetical protein MH252_09505 [Thermosynechococcaceae cyanobacterium MS004]|nr:hypothetical protein [Thermosynechococcaceae cyanobacterium MS004]
MNEPEPLLTQQELHQWHRGIAEANRNNVFCHCRSCQAEWVASGPTACTVCSSKDVEFILCWQFPDG